MKPTRTHHEAVPGTAALYEKHGIALYRYLLGMLGRPEDAEDVLQTVWTRLVDRIERVRDPAAYLWRMARNEGLANALRLRRGDGSVDPSQSSRNPVKG